jgi:hypothetical protein
VGKKYSFSGNFTLFSDEITRKSSRRGENSSMKVNKLTIPLGIANPERSSGGIFRELQRLSPGRYQPLHIRTLQRGMRKI